MADEFKLQQDRASGMRAEHLLRDEIVQEAFKRLEAEYLKVWSNTAPTEWRTREHMWRAVQILGDVQKHLVTVIHNGMIANKELNDLAQKPIRAA